MSNVFYENGRLVIDLHQCLVDEARVLLSQQLDMVPPGVSEVRVIHGFHQGSALLEMVRNDFRHKRISKKYRGLNKGITVFLLR